MPKEYIVFAPDEEYTFDPAENPLKLACCDCSLTHNLYFRVNADGTLTFNLEVDMEETERLRNNPDIKDKAFEGVDIG